MQGSGKQDPEKQDPDKNYGSFKSSIGDVTNGQVVVGHGNAVGEGNIVGDGNIVAREGSAAAGPRGAAATGQSAAATEGATAAAGQRPASMGLAERARKSPVVKTSGVIAVLTVLCATGLLISGTTNLAVAGYIVAVIAVIVGVIPLFSDR